MSKEIYVITNTPLRDIQEFNNYFEEYIDKNYSNKILLKGGRTLIFHRNENMRGIGTYYLYHEVFESFLKQMNKDLQHKLKEKQEVINRAIYDLKESIDHFLSEKEIAENDVKVIHMRTVRERYLKPILKILER